MATREDIETTRNALKSAMMALVAIPFTMRDRDLLKAFRLMQRTHDDLGTFLVSTGGNDDGNGL